MMKDGQVKWVMAVIFILLVFLKIIPAALVNFDLWYPLDDAYICHQFASNLAAGHFLTFSVGEPLTNGCTSFLYYLLNAAVIFVLKIFMTGELLFKTTQLVLMGINFIFYGLAIIIFKKIFEYLIPSAKWNLIFWILLSVFSMNTILFSAFSGLEVALTLLLVMLESYYFVTDKHDRLFIVMLIANINRPENIVMNMFIVAYYYAKILFKKIKLNRFTLFCFCLAQTSLIAVPLINYISLGSVFLSSATRVGVSDSSNILLQFCWMFMTSVMKNLGFLNFFALIFFLPEYYLPKVETIRMFSLSMLVPVLIFGCYLHSLRQLNNSFFKILIVFTSYLALHFFVGNVGEWGRYVVPVFPMFMLLVYVLCSHVNLSFMKLIALITLIINLFVFPVWCYYSVETLKIEHRLIWPIAKYIEGHLKTTDRIGIDSAGILSVNNPGVSIDVYGLGTKRYASIHGDFKSVYQQIRNDRLNYFITWPTKDKSYYLDSAHYGAAYEGKAKIKKIFSAKYDETYLFHKEFPKELALYRVIHL